MKTLEPPRTVGGNGPRPPARTGGGGGGGDPAAAIPGATVRMGLWFFLTAVTMLFIAFTVGYAARRTAPDWTVIALPPILWGNTLLLLASSISLEWARRGWRRDPVALRRGLSLTTLLGAAFLAGQITAWRELAAAGAFMATSPHSAYFHLLTAVHGLHLLGGLGVLGYALRRTAIVVPAGAAGVPAGEAVGLAATLDNVAIYWHFLTALWVYVFVMLLS